MGSHGIAATPGRPPERRRQLAAADHAGDPAVVGGRTGQAGDHGRTAVRAARARRVSGRLAARARGPHADRSELGVGCGEPPGRRWAADARRTELTLTAAGRALLRRAPELAQTRLVAALRDVPAARLRVTASVL